MKKLSILLTALLLLALVSSALAPAMAINPRTQVGKATGGGAILSCCDPTQVAKFSFTASETKNGIKGNVETLTLISILPHGPSYV